MTSLGIKILNKFSSCNDFNILVTDELKRRFKTLIALNKKYPIVSATWVARCIKEQKIVDYEPFRLTKVLKNVRK